MKRSKRWRTTTGGARRFTYDGFLICDACGEHVYSTRRRVAFYVCRARKLRGECATRYVRQDVLLTWLFAQHHKA